MTSHKVVTTEKSLISGLGLQLIDTTIFFGIVDRLMCLYVLELNASLLFQWLSFAGVLAYRSLWPNRCVTYA